MKHNWKSILSMIIEYIVLVVPTAGYSIYCYQDTLTHTMSATSKGLFWSLIAVAILAIVIFKLCHKKYERFVAGYVQQKTDIETRPNDELLIKKVAEKSKIIDSVDYIFAAIPVLILMVIVTAFQSAIDQLLIILEIVAGSLIGKAGLHALTVSLKSKGMLKAIPKDGEK